MAPIRRRTSRILLLDHRDRLLLLCGRDPRAERRVPAVHPHHVGGAQQLVDVHDRQPHLGPPRTGLRGGVDVLIPSAGGRT
ncbi:hypothetical protein AMK19_08270 [Kitasatospora sp. CB01950]|nr:hypothetical protein AMK19_08270 [Kitasatospora sp. CB01950]